MGRDHTLFAKADGVCIVPSCCHCYVVVAQLSCYLVYMCVRLCVTLSLCLSLCLSRMDVAAGCIVSIREMPILTSRNALLGRHHHTSSIFDSHSIIVLYPQHQSPLCSHHRQHYHQALDSMLFSYNNHHRLPSRNSQYQGSSRICLAYASVIYPVHHQNTSLTLDPLQVLASAVFITPCYRP
jgi:hypothetical protein